MPEETDQIIEIPVHDGNEIEDEKCRQSSREATSDQPVVEKALGSGPSEQENYYDQWLRLRAEFQNYKRRNEEKLQEWRDSAGRDLVSQLLPIIDDFDILFSHHAAESSGRLLDGVRFIHSKLTSTLKELGLEVMPTDNVHFDPEIHDAVMTEVTAAVEEGKIIGVWQKGFFYKGTLLRPAKVIVAKRGEF